MALLMAACSPSEQTPTSPAEQSAAALASDKQVLQQGLQTLKSKTDATHKKMLSVLREPDSPQKTQQIWQLLQQVHQQELAVWQGMKLQHSQAQLSLQTLLDSATAMADLAGKIAEAYGKNDIATGNQLEAEYNKHNTESSQALAEMEQLIKTP